MTLHHRRCLRRGINYHNHHHCRSTSILLLFAIACSIVVVTMSLSTAASGNNYVGTIPMNGNTVLSSPSAPSPPPQQQQHPQRRWLVVDYDETCTFRDTTPLLPRLAARLAQDNETQTAARLEAFAALEQEFLTRYAQAAANQLDDDIINSRPWTLDHALNALEDVSNQITHKVSAAQILRGLGGDNYNGNAPSCADMVKLLNNDEEFKDWVQLRPDCLSVLSRAAVAATVTTSNTAPSSAWQLGVLSINWSPLLIEASLVQPLCQEIRQRIKEQQQQEQQQRKTAPPPSSTTTTIPNISIWSNQVDADGNVALLVPGASAKRHRIAQLRQPASSDSNVASFNNNNNNSSNNNGNAVQQKHQQQQPRQFVVYVGDSSTDLTALVEADVGILLGQSKSAVAMAEKWGISIRPLTNIDSTHTETNNNNVIWKAESWSEIGQFLESPDLIAALEQQQQQQLQQQTQQP